MKCQCCNNTATIHITEINNGQRVETHLCEQCAQKQGVAVKNQIPLNELLSTLLAVQSGSAESSSTDSDKKQTACPVCGMTMEKFRKNSLLGCENDYELFKEQLEPLIERTHNGTARHCGKMPSAMPEDRKKQIEIINLKQQLHNAVKSEDYETAAKLRDRIEQL